VEKVKLLINGEFIDSQTTKWIDVHNPVSSSTQKGLGGFFV